MSPVWIFDQCGRTNFLFFCHKTKLLHMVGICQTRRPSKPKYECNFPATRLRVSIQKTKRAVFSLFLRRIESSEPMKTNILSVILFFSMNFSIIFNAVLERQFRLKFWTNKRKFDNCFYQYFQPFFLSENN